MPEYNKTSSVPKIKAPEQEFAFEDEEADEALVEQSLKLWNRRHGNFVPKDKLPKPIEV